VPHTLEEAYEVAEKALAGPPDAALVDELGDLLFQTYFLAVLTREAGAGDLQAVAEGIEAKLVRRHPHVYGPGGAPIAVRRVAGDGGDLRRRGGRGRRGRRALALGDHQARPGGPAGHLPRRPVIAAGLLHARKVQRRAAAVGFDWTRWQDAWPSLLDEIRELREALDAADGRLGREVEPPADVRHEAGDVLFATVNVLRLGGVDPELALRAASARFRSRVEAAERSRPPTGRSSACSGSTSRTSIIGPPSARPLDAPRRPTLGTPAAPREPRDRAGRRRRA
jgi:uncharacterized protein YabN with tetrapyrrole methylase and pyrophosphatase domain